jgi:hypothetical protein
MKRLIFLMVLVCVLAPATARANSGGFWDFIYGLDPKLVGVGTDLHVLCLNGGGERVKGCEEYWGLRRLFLHLPMDPEVKTTKHEFNFRLVYYRKYGASYEGVPESEDTSINAFKFMGMYNYHVDNHLSVALGGGIMPFWGARPDPVNSSESIPFDSFSRVVLTPLSVTYAPATTGSLLKRTFYLRGESTFFKEGFSRGDFDNRFPKTETKGEWQFSIAAGFDLLRR